MPAANATRSWSVPFAFGSAQIGPVGQGILLQVIAELPNAGHIHLSGRTDAAYRVLRNETLRAAARASRHASGRNRSAGPPLPRRREYAVRSFPAPAFRRRHPSPACGGAGNA